MNIKSWTLKEQVKNLYSCIRNMQKQINLLRTVNVLRINEIKELKYEISIIKDILSPGEPEVKEEPAAPELTWWCVPGMYVMNKATGTISHQRIEDISKETNNVVLSNDKILIFEEIKQCYKPVGGPFDMIPEWANEIKFNDDGDGYFFDLNTCENWFFHAWHNCPDEFKGNTYSLEGLK